MAADIYLFIKDILSIKAPKKSPWALRMIVLTFSMLFGLYICSVCLKQVSIHTNIGLANVEVVQRPCQPPNIEPWEKPYVHYPHPKTFSRAECRCNPVRYFAILSTQRSGSGWFETLLNSHLNISSNGEIFSVKVRRSNISTIVETLDNIYNLDWLTSASKNECTAAVGLKWMLNQGLMKHHEEIVEYFNTKGVSAIFLFRRNLLRRMISILANSYDQNARPLNGTHKSHVHSPLEVSVCVCVCVCVLYSERVILLSSKRETGECVSGRNTCKIQTYDQYNINYPKSETSRRDDRPSYTILQQHSTHCPLLRGHNKKSHETARCPRFSKGSSDGSDKSTSEDTQRFLVSTG